MMYEQQAILFNPSRVHQAVHAARQALAKAQYAEAQKLMAPFSTGRLPAQFAAPILDILGRCALAGVGRDWPDLMRRARTGFHLVGDGAAAARVQERVALGYMARGEFNVAHKALQEAAQDFREAGDERGQASCTLTEVRLLLRRGMFQAALRQSQAAMQKFARLQDKKGEALSRLARAQVYAALQQAGEAAPDLLWAERLVGADASRLTRVRLGLARAKVLVELGHRRRAVAGLTTLEHAVDAMDAMPVRADFARCMGLGLAHDDPSGARSYLEQARSLHERLGQRYHVVECELGLARVEMRIGYNVGARLDALRGYNLAAWPLLTAQWQLVRAMRPRAAPPGFAGPPAASSVSVKQPASFVSRLQAAFGWVLRGEDDSRASLGADVTSATTTNKRTLDDDGPGTEWGPFSAQARPKEDRPQAQASARKKKNAPQNEEEQVNYVSAIRSASLDMRV